MPSKSVKRALFSRWLIVLLFIFSLALVLHNSFSYLDPDFGWHYAVGREIWQNHAVPRLEHHLLPIAGQSWVDHEWLSNVLIYLTYNWGGYLLVSFLFALLTILIWYLLAQETIKHWLDNKTNSVVFWLLLLISLKASLPNLGVRVQEITVFFVVLLNIWLAQSVRQRKWPTWKIIVVPLLFWLWASLHGGFLIGLAIFTAWFFFRLILYWLPHKSNKGINILPKGVIIRSGLTLVLSWIATCLTPYGLGLYQFLGDYGTSRAYLWCIVEWLPMTEALCSWRMVYFIIFGLALALLIFHCCSHDKHDREMVLWLKQQDWWTLILSLILWIAAWRSLRHFPLFAVVSLPWMAGFFYHSWHDNLFQPDTWPNYLKWFVAVIVILTSLLLIIDTHWSVHPEKDYCHTYPCVAMSYLRQSPYASWPTIVEYGWGGYFYWLWPEKPIFIDGRLPQYMWRGQSLIEHYGRFFKETEVKKALDDYGLDVIVIPQPRPVHYNWAETLFLGRGLAEEDYYTLSDIVRWAMLKSPDWRLVHADITAMIYVRQ